MKRREFITLLSGTAATWPLAARAQQALPTIGVLGGTTSSIEGQRIAAFTRRLNELGWIEGRTVAIELRWGEGRPERFTEIATEFVRAKVDVILAAGTAPTIAAKQATTTIPIVFPLGGDPVRTGLVASLALPGSNVTGLSNEATDVTSKKLEILREVVPALRRLGVLANVAYPGGSLEIDEVRIAVNALGIEFVTSEVRRAQDILPAIDTLKGRAEALYVVGDPLLNINRVRIVTLALAARLPTMFVQRDYVDAGGLMSYGPNFVDLFRRAAEYVDKILRGAKAGEIPVEQPTTFDLVINLTTAKALGLTVPPTLLARADEVIE